MTDIFSKKRRSEIMSRIRSKNTKIEKLVFSRLRARGVYFQRHYRKAPGNPDIALPKKMKAVFVDGDFWHGYKFTTFKNRLPEFWRRKIENNIRRDTKNRAKLRRMDWVVLRIWEHELERDFDKTVEKIISFLQSLPKIPSGQARARRKGGVGGIPPRPSRKRSPAAVPEKLRAEPSRKIAFSF